MTLILVFLGPPGSGKGTQAKLLAERMSIPHISLGDILREEVRQGTEIGCRAKEIIEAGHLVPDEMTIAITRKKIAVDDCKKGFIIDGFPRSSVQAKGFDEMLEEMRLNLDAVVYFRIAEEEVVARLSGRRSCRNCGAVYHLKNKPPRMEGRCDLCGGEIYLRRDDEESVIRTRFEVYAQQTRPLIEHYARKGKIVELDAAKSVNEVFLDLLRIKAVAMVL